MSSQEKEEIIRALRPFAEWFRVMGVLLDRDRQRGITRKDGWEDIDPVLSGFGQIVTRGAFRRAAELHDRLLEAESGQ